MPSSLEKQILERVDALLSIGKKLVPHHPQFKTSPLPVQADSYMYWRTKALNFLSDVLGAQHVYTTEFISVALPPQGGYSVVLPDWVKKGQSVLQAVRDDFAAGFLIDFRLLVSGEVFSDLMEQAEHLQSQGYHNPAASLVGAILEDGLRRIATKRRVNHKQSDDLSTLNQKLAQAGIYTRLQQKKVQMWNDIRNSADHGHFDQYSASDVKEMLIGVGSFLSEYLR